MPSSTAERIQSCEFTFSNRRRGKVCRPSLATSRAADFHRNMVRGPPPAPSARKRLLRIISLAMRSREQSRLRDFSSGVWPRKPQLRPEAARHGDISRGIPRLRARVFALGRRDQVGTAPPSIAGNGQDLDSGGSRGRTWLGSDSPAQRKVSTRKIAAVLVEERAALSCPHAEEPRLKRRAPCLVNALWRGVSKHEGHHADSSLETRPSW